MGGITLADRNAQGIAEAEHLIKDVNSKMDVLKVIIKYVRPEISGKHGVGDRGSTW